MEDVCCSYWKELTICGFLFGINLLLQFHGSLDSQFMLACWISGIKLRFIKAPMCWGTKLPLFIPFGLAMACEVDNQQSMCQNCHLEKLVGGCKPYEQY